MSIVAEKGHWNLHETDGKKQWAVEMSELHHNPVERKCPGCERTLRFGYAIGQVHPVPDTPGADIQMWSGRCLCGTELVIFND